MYARHWHIARVILADITVSKTTSAPLLWSTEAERSHPLSQHPAASSKKPAFNLSAFGSPSSVSTPGLDFSPCECAAVSLTAYRYPFLQSLGNISVFKTSQLGDSPFYSGKTTYGGAAAAARETKGRIASYQVWEEWCGGRVSVAEIQKGQHCQRSCEQGAGNATSVPDLPSQPTRVEDFCFSSFLTVMVSKRQLWSSFSLLWPRGEACSPKWDLKINNKMLSVSAD